MGHVTSVPGSLLHKRKEPGNEAGQNIGISSPKITWRAIQLNCLIDINNINANTCTVHLVSYIDNETAGLGSKWWKNKGGERNQH